MTGTWKTPLCAAALALAPALALGEVLAPQGSGEHDVALVHSYEIDTDGDGLSNGLESLDEGTDPLDPDTDGDGWLDGPANLRYSLLLLSIGRTDLGVFGCDGLDDDLYLVVDDVRWPRGAADSGNAAIDGWWTLEDGDTIAPWTWLEHRTVPQNGPTKLMSEIELWDDDADLDDDWSEDDFYSSTRLDLLQQTPWVPFDVTLGDACREYVVTMAVAVAPFADPDPLDALGDSDDDGLVDADEAALARALYGMADPGAQDVWVELDWASDVYSWEPRARTMVVSQFRRHGINLRIDDGRFGGGGKVAHTGVLWASDLDAHYESDFALSRRGLFRYALLAGDLWNGRSSGRVDDRFALDADSYWFSGDATAQAGVFMHELGHALGLVRERYPASFIDTASTSPDALSYVSCMNYLFQYLVVDYSAGDGPAHGDLDDWSSLDLGFDLPAWTITLLASP